MKQHWAIFINNDSNKAKLLKQLLRGILPNEFSFLAILQGAMFSKLALEQLMDEEDRHGTKTIAKETEQPLRTMSSGEQKKALLTHY